MPAKTAKSSTKNGSRRKKEATPLPMYFLSLEVENARCFGPKQKLDLSDGNGKPKPWTVLLGENGVGKTTLLQVLVNSTQIEESQVRNKDGQMEEWIRLSTRQLVDFIRNGESVGIFLEYGLGSFGTIKERKILEVEVNGFMGLIRNFNPKHFNGFFCLGYGATRRMRLSSLSAEGDGQLSNSETLFSEEVFLGNAEEWLLQLRLAEAVTSGLLKEQNRRILSEILEILMKVLPDVSGIGVAEPREAGKQPRIFFGTPFGRIFISALGIGHRTMIAWIVDLARRMFERYPNSPDPIAEPAVVLVDEIDLHLHPTWQRKLIGFLSERFKKTQFIVTAHSPLMVQAALDYDANVAVLRREGDHVVIENDVADRLRGLRVDQILTTVFGLMSARSPKLDALLEERERILSKHRLTKADSARLKELREEIGEMPTGERPEDIEAMDIIRRAAAALEEGATNGVDKNKPTKPSSKSASNTRRRGRATAAR